LLRKLPKTPGLLFYAAPCISAVIFDKTELARC